MNKQAWGDDQTQFFFELTPDRVLEAVEASGLRCTGRCMALNSFENRVYDVELEAEEESAFKYLAAGRRVVKFYRPGRWSERQILEEHEFLQDLRDSEIPAIAPLKFPDGRTLHQAKGSGIFYTIFPKVGGRAPDEFTDDQLIRIGRLLGRIHTVGASKKAPHRVEINASTYGRANLEYFLNEKWIPLDFQARYKTACEKIFVKTDEWMQGVESHRLHGDCHPGNLLWNTEGPFFLDFDDMVTGPAAQDIWLLIPGRDPEARAQREVLLEGYQEMRKFDRATLKLIEPLRALRFVHYTAWIARRWKDPAFPAAFPEFNTHQYWSDETSDLEEQVKLIYSE